MLKKAENYTQDIEELKRLKDLCQRDSVKFILDDKIEMLARYIDSVSPQKTSTESLDEKQPVTSTVGCTFESLTSYSWDQETDKIKIYITVPSTHPINSDLVTVEFKETSLVVKVYDQSKKMGKQLILNKLFKEINPKSSSYKVSQKMIIVTLVKRDTQWWEDLKKNDTKKKATVKPPSNANTDPGKSLMDLMRNLYEEGDDEMKRTIAKAWTESHEKLDKNGLMPTPF